MSSYIYIYSSCLHFVIFRQLAYWKNKLNGLPSLALPLDKPRPSSLGSSGMQIPIKIGPDIINQFKAVVKSDGANLYGKSII